MSFKQLNQEAAAVGLGAHFQQGLPFFELQWQAGGHVIRKRLRRFDADVTHSWP